MFQQEVECLRQDALSGGTEQVGPDVLEISMATPDNSQRFEEIRIDMRIRKKWAGEISNRRCGDVENSWRTIPQPAVVKNLRDLTIKAIILGTSEHASGEKTHGDALAYIDHEHPSEQVSSLRVDEIWDVVFTRLDFTQQRADILVVKRKSAC